MDVGLSDLIGGLIVEVFGCEGSSVNHGKARIALADAVLLDQLHSAHLCSNVRASEKMFSRKYTIVCSYLQVLKDSDMLVPSIYFVIR
jgi:hypothetical protein